jgi:hypothetical protein
VESADFWDFLRWVFILFIVVGVVLLVRAWLTSPRRNAK